jgi:hypothetical protein
MTHASSALGHPRQRETLGSSQWRGGHLLRVTLLSDQSRDPTTDGIIPARTLGLVVSRSISGGMHEDLDVTNNGMKRVGFQLEIALRCDFADIFEVKSGGTVRRGRIVTTWSETKQ